MSSEPENVDYRETLNVTKVHAATSREKAEPVVKHEPLPFWPLICFFGITIVASGYIGKNSGEFDPMATVKQGYKDTIQTPGGGESAVQGDTGTPEEIWVKKGGKIFKKGACAGCHGGSGMGVPGQFPPLADSEWVNGGTERLAMILLHGLAGPMTVKGKGYNGQMPPQGLVFDDAQLAQLMSFIRQNWGNTGDLVTEEMVAFAREKYKGQAGSFKEGDLKAVGEETNLPGDPFGATAVAEGS